MRKKPQRKVVKKEDLPKTAGDNHPSQDDPSWETDQRERSYYYDDAYGYEKYVPQEDDDQDRAK